MKQKPLNCWEFMKCGRQPGGDKLTEFGVCPASEAKSLDGMHRGVNAGRACWNIAGTFCGGEVQGTYASKQDTCAKCDFFQQVLRDEMR